MSDLGNFRVPLPGRHLERLAAEVEALQESQREWEEVGARMPSLIEERKRALITACMTGEFDVSTASSRAGGAALAGGPKLG